MKEHQPIRRRQALITAFLMCLGVGLFALTDLFHLLVLPLAHSDPLRQSDALVVFGGGLAQDGQLGISTDERVRYAADLFHQDYAALIILSGGYRVAPRFEETETMAALLMDLGIESDRIVQDRYARNTYENARRVYAECSRRGLKQIILVTSPYHMQRAVGCLRRYPLTVLAAPVPDSEIYRSGLPERFRAIDLVLHEYVGLVNYWWRGWI